MRVFLCSMSVYDPMSFVIPLAHGNEIALLSFPQKKKKKIKKYS